MNSEMTHRMGLLLRLLRAKAGLDQGQLASRLGLSQATISRWELGRYLPSREQVDGLISACCAAASARAAMHLALDSQLPPAHREGGCVPSSLAQAQALRGLDAELEAGLRSSSGAFDAKLPCYAYIAAGLGESQEPREGPRGYIRAPQNVLDADPTAYALLVTGDSMQPLLLPGDVVVVSPGAALMDGCIAAAYIEPDGDVVKRYRVLKDGTLELSSMNQAYEPILVHSGGSRSARIWGRVVLVQREL